VATITNYQDRRTVAYAELWSAESFIVSRNTLWWPRAGSLPAERKGDERGIGGVYKVDIPGPCWVVWEGTTEGVRILQTQQAASAGQLDSPPGLAFLPVYPGVSVVTFEGTIPQPEPAPDPSPLPDPMPQPDPIPEPAWVPQVVTFYGSGGIVEPQATRWGDRELVYAVPLDWIREAFLGTLGLFERVQGTPVTRMERG
jgi:hypothetical protein